MDEINEKQLIAEMRRRIAILQNNLWHLRKIAKLVRELYPPEERLGKLRRFTNGDYSYGEKVE